MYLQGTIGYVLTSYLYKTILSMTWLKQRIKELGLFRRGPDVQYTALSCVKAAIRVGVCSMSS